MNSEIQPNYFWASVFSKSTVHCTKYSKLYLNNLYVLRQSGNIYENGSALI